MYQRRKQSAEQPIKSDLPDYSRIPISDLNWVTNQPSSVWKLFCCCWNSDRFGSRWMELNHNLSLSSFRSARKILEKNGLFIFRKIQDYSDARVTSRWEVKNLKGCRVATFWKTGIVENKVVDFLAKKSVGNSEPISKSEAEIDGKNEIGVKFSAGIGQKNPENQGFQKPSISPQQQLNNSSEELLSCEIEKTSLGGEAFSKDGMDGMRNSEDATSENIGLISISDCLFAKSETPDEKLQVDDSLNRTLPKDFLLEFSKKGWDKSDYSAQEVLSIFGSESLPPFFPETNYQGVNSSWNVDTPDGKQEVEKKFQSEQITPEYAQMKKKAIAGFLDKLKSKVVSNCKSSYHRQFLKNKYDLRQQTSSASEETSRVGAEKNNFSTNDDESEVW